VDDPYAEVKAHFAEVAGVTVSSGRGAQGLKLGKRMFAMFYKGDLLVTLSPERVAALIAEGTGLAFDPGTAKTMADRVLVPASRREHWVSLCEESRRYAESRG
jgi:hypothetical protein